MSAYNITESKKPLLVFFGGVKRGDYETLVARGIDVAVVVDKRWDFALHNNKVFKFIKFIKVRDLGNLPISELFNLFEINESSIIINVIEPFVYFYAQVMLKIGIVSTLPEAANTCLNKDLMRNRFKKFIGEWANPKHTVIKNNSDLYAFFHTIKGPVVLKPTNLYGSKFISINYTKEDLLYNYRLMRQGLDKYFKDLKEPPIYNIQAEEYIHGTNHSIDCVVDQNGEVYLTPIVDVLTGHDIGIKDFHHFARISHSKLPKVAQKKLNELAIAGIKALDLKSCIAHVELINSDQGAKLLEIAARPGGNRANILLNAFGIDLMYAYYQVVLGHKPNVELCKNKSYAIVSPFPTSIGTLVGVNEAQIKHLSSYLGHSLRFKIGTSIGPVTNGFFAPMSIDLCHPRLEVLYSDIMQIASIHDLFRLS